MIMKKLAFLVLILVLASCSVVRKNTTVTGQQIEVSDIVPFESGKLDKDPSFKGGNHDTFINWVTSQLSYPEDAKEKAIQGVVTLRFVVMKDGSVTNVKVLRGVDTSLDEEAIRVVSSSPKWTPGIFRGEKVNVRYTFPVVFRLK